MICIGLGETGIVAYYLHHQLQQPSRNASSALSDPCSFIINITLDVAIILLAFCDKPKMGFFVTRVRTHLWSCWVYSVLWLIITAMLASRLPEACDFSRPSDGENEFWCALIASDTGVAFVLGALCKFTASPRVDIAPLTLFRLYAPYNHDSSAGLLGLLYSLSALRHGKGYLSSNVAQERDQVLDEGIAMT
ncbi:hypothetical protein HGRIS_010244 [Hohenbuehelia grisea]|uniref:Integral membrane protein n=1 Tax=Hohenbuehelia grisea TaxID=104357 RepID=A0ABR3J3Q5_9AGAR